MATASVKECEGGAWRHHKEAIHRQGETETCTVRETVVGVTPTPVPLAVSVNTAKPELTPVTSPLAETLANHSCDDW
jgi:hypothetical protein